MSDHMQDSSAPLMDSTPRLPFTPTVANDNLSLEDTQTSHDNDNGVIRGMHQASASLTELIKTVKKYGILYGELQKLCQKLGLRYDQDSNVEETFKKIQDLFVEYQQMAESERMQRDEVQAYSQQTKRRLEQSEAEKGRYESLISQQEQQIVQHTDLISKLEMNFRQAQQQMQNMQDRFVQELNDEKRNKSNLHKAYLDAESKKSELEKRAELACQEAMAALDQQRSQLVKCEQERLELKQQTVQLAQEKREVEEKYTALCKTCDDPGDPGDILTAQLAEEDRKAALTDAALQVALSPLPENRETSEIVPSEQGDGISPMNKSSVPDLDVAGRWNLSPSKRHKNLSRTLVLPHVTRTLGCVSAFHLTPRGLGGPSGSNGSGTNEEGSRLTRQRVGCPPSEGSNRLKGRAAFPHSVVSGPVVLGNGLHRKSHDHPSFSAWSPGSSDLVIQSESTDSAMTDDQVNDGFHQSSQCDNSAVEVNAYDYGEASYRSSLPTSDYDSVNGSMLRTEEHNGFNPLRWMWQRKGNVMGGVRTGMSCAAKTGAQVSKSVWTWATVAAVAAGTVTLNHSSFADAADFSDSDETDSQASFSLEVFKG